MNEVSSEAAVVVRTDGKLSDSFEVNETLRGFCSFHFALIFIILI